MNFGRPDYEQIQDTSNARQISLTALQLYKELPSASILNRLAREVLNFKVDDPVPTDFDYFPDSTTHLIPHEEPVFLLRAQDELAARTLEHWIHLAKSSGVNKLTIEVAQMQLNRFYSWYKRKKPDVRPSNF